MARRDFTVVRDKFARDNGLPFGRLLSREFVLSALEGEGHKYRSRVFCPLVTLWGWLSQCLSQDKSLNETVSRILAHRVSIGLPACSASSAAYTKARTRFPESAMKRMAQEIGRQVHNTACDSWKWRGREVFLADGTGFSMPDSPENQLAYPQSGASLPGVGFPVMRAVALISLSTGAVIDMGFATFAGKGTGELSLLGQLMDSLNRGSVLLADRYYPTFATVAQLQRRGVDLVSVSHHSREVDFSAGHVLGPKDHIVEWRKPQHRDYLDSKAQRELPDSVWVREFAIEIESRNGGRLEAIVVTTMIDPTIPQKEIADLYWQRWNCELDIRSIKHSLNMDKVLPFTRDEIDGCFDAFRSVPAIELLQIQKDAIWRGVHLDPPRSGRHEKSHPGYACHRGSYLQLGDSEVLLWTQGNVPQGDRDFFKEMKGTPKPLLIRRFAGQGPFSESCRTILGLTKMDWNNDALYDRLPVTQSFASVLAETLKRMPSLTSKPYPFRLFM